MTLQYLKLSVVFFIGVTTLGQARPYENRDSQFSCQPDARLATILGDSSFFAHENDIAAMSFIDDHTLIVSGYARPNSKPVPIKQQIKIDLAKSKVSLLPQPNVEPLQKICTQRCQTYIVGQSPNHRWQLAIVTKTTGDGGELWLIGQRHSRRLSNHMPWALTISWSDDSQLLWATWMAIENGTDRSLIRLDEPPYLFAENSDVLNLIGNQVTLLPKLNHVLVVGSDTRYVANGTFREYLVRGRQLFLLTSQQLSNTLIGTQWNEATKESFNVFADGKKMEVVGINNKTRIMLDGEGYQQAVGSLGPMIRNFYGTGPIIAYSTSKKYLAVALGKVFLFSCK